MARKPNYQFDRQERERAKAAKIASKAKQREQPAADRGANGGAPEPRS